MNFHSDIKIAFVISVLQSFLKIDVAQNNI